MAKLNFQKLAGGMFQTALATGTGAVVANGANTVMRNITKSLDSKMQPWVRAVGLIAIGTVGVDLIGMGKSTFARAAGHVVAGKGSEQILRVLVPQIVSGVDDDDIGNVDDDDAMSGLSGEDIIEGPDGSEAVAGIGSENKAVGNVG